MSKGGLIIRLIDVVFNLLFAFIAISQLDLSLTVEPAKSTEAAEFNNDSTRVVVVSVLQNGQYPINDGQIVLEDSTKLNQFLSELAEESAKEGKAIGIRIRSYWDSPVAYSLAAAKICRSLGLPKGLDAIRVAKQTY